MSVKKLYKTRIIKTVSFICLILPVLAGCSAPGSLRPESGKTVVPGSVADISFLCRLQTGDIVAATDKTVGEQQALPKSIVYLPIAEDGPVSVTAAATQLLPNPTGMKERAFEEDIVERLANVVVGMEEGESRTVELTAQELPERRQEDYVIRVARVRQRAKEMRMSVAEYQLVAGKSPEQGQSFFVDPAIPGRVETITQDEVIIRGSAKTGDEAPTPFGLGHIRETDNDYEIVIDARKGDLVRSGPFVGRITGVDDKYITIDYRDPFGGQTLICDLKVEKVADAKPVVSEAGK